MTRDDLCQEIRRLTPPLHADDLIDQVGAYVTAERERIAQGIEALPIYNDGGYDLTLAYSLGYQLGRKHGAHVARGEL